MTKNLRLKLCVKTWFSIFIFHIFSTIFSSIFECFVGCMPHKTKNKNGMMGARHMPIPIKDDSMQVESSLCQFLHCKDECVFCDFHEEPTNEKLTNMPYCCENQNIRDIYGQLTCIYCGQVVGEDFKTGYINFHANLFKIYKKTVYNRKYHLSHTLDQIILKNKVEISCSTNFKIHKIFVEINKILQQINGKRKRIISLKYLLHRILQLMKIDSSQIELTKSKKTMKLYNVYWDKIMDIIGPQIMHIINHT